MCPFGDVQYLHSSILSYLAPFTEQEWTQTFKNANVQSQTRRHLILLLSYSERQQMSKWMASCQWFSAVVFSARDRRKQALKC